MAYLLHYLVSKDIMQITNMSILLNPFSEITFHPSVFKTEVSTLSGTRLTLKLLPGENVEFLKTGVAGRIEMGTQKRSFVIADLKIRDNWTYLTCRLHKTFAVSEMTAA